MTKHKKIILSVWVEDKGPVYQGIVRVAVSPDGHEAEISAPFRGFM